MDTKIIGLVLLICSIFLFQYSYDDVAQSFLSPSEKLKNKIEKNISNSIEKEFSKNNISIHHIDIKYRSKFAHDFLLKHQPKFTTNSNGNIWLEIEILDLPDEENPGIITQTSVFDLKSKNKIAEYAKTYMIKDYEQSLKKEKTNIKK